MHAQRPFLWLLMAEVWPILHIACSGRSMHGDDSSGITPYVLSLHLTWSNVVNALDWACLSAKHSPYLGDRVPGAMYQKKGEGRKAEKTAI